MSIYPNAVLKLLPENETEPRIRPKLAIWHSAVDHPGPTSLYPYFSRDDVTLESHFFIKFDGTVEQYMDTHRQADANYKANGFWRSGQYWGAVSVETEDDGDPNNTRWSRAQHEASVELGRWLVEEHGIPPVLCPEWNAEGFGYHSQYPGVWTPYRGKTCPGTIRIPQFVDEILPAIAGNGGDPLAAFTEDDIRRLAREGAKQALNEGTAHGTTSWASTAKKTLGGVQANHNAIRALTGMLGRYIREDGDELDPKAIAEALLEAGIGQAVLDALIEGREP